MKTISLKVPDEMNAKLEVRARRTGKSKSDITREALAVFLDETKKKGEVSCLDLVKDLAGRVHGPKDLASNKKYLRDYGR
jgi:predicted DNA-binding protein